VRARRRNGSAPPQCQGLQRYCGDEFEFWARRKRASLLHDWIEGTPVDVLERRFSTTPFQGAVSYGDIIRVADGARFHLRSAHQILSTLFPGEPVFLPKLDELLRRLEFGLPAAALQLVSIPLALSRGNIWLFTRQTVLHITT
jgi:helicase